MHKKIYKKALKVIPNGSMLFSKKPEIYLPGGWPTYFKKSKGIFIWNLNNKKLNDLYFGVGQNILGYANPKIDREVINACKNGNMSSLNCVEEVKLAEKLVEMHPWADMVKFARSGGEINSIAIRIARAATGKDGVVICGYHGWHDWYLAANLKNKQSLNKHILKGLDPHGVSKSLKNTVFTFNYNDFNQLKKIVSKKNIGTIMMEVKRDKEPKDNFLKKVRKLCDEKKIVLIFDECTSGFRHSVGGLHKCYKVNPDMAVFGKALGNGYAITSLLGRRSIMEEAQKTFISSTFWTERIGYVAALKTLSEMKKLQSWKIITENGLYVKKLWRDIANDNGLDLNIFGLDAIPSFSFKNKNLEYKTLIIQEMLKKNYLVSNSVFLSVGHNKRVIKKYINHLNNVFRLIKKCEDGDNIYKYLKYPVCYSPFDRLN